MLYDTQYFVRYDLDRYLVMIFFDSSELPTANRILVLLCPRILGLYIGASLMNHSDLTNELEIM